jgi:hypothetical protein
LQIVVPSVTFPSTISPALPDCFLLHAQGHFISKTKNIVVYYFITGDMENAEKYYRLALEKYPFNSSSIEKLNEIKMAKSKAKADK